MGLQWVQSLKLLLLVLATATLAFFLIWELAFYSFLQGFLVCICAYIYIYTIYLIYTHVQTSSRFWDRQMYINMFSEQHGEHRIRHAFKAQRNLCWTSITCCQSFWLQLWEQPNGPVHLKSFSVWRIYFFAWLSDIVRSCVMQIPFAFPSWHTCMTYLIQPAPCFPPLPFPASTSRILGAETNSDFTCSVLHPVWPRAEQVPMTSDFKQN